MLRNTILRAKPLAIRSVSTAAPSVLRVAARPALKPFKTSFVGLRPLAFVRLASSEANITPISEKKNFPEIPKIIEKEIAEFPEVEFPTEVMDDNGRLLVKGVPPPPPEIVSAQTRWQEFSQPKINAFKQEFLKRFFIPRDEVLEYSGAWWWERAVFLFICTASGLALLALTEPLTSTIWPQKFFSRPWDFWLFVAVVYPIMYEFLFLMIGGILGRGHLCRGVAIKGLSKGSGNLFKW